MNGKTHVTFLKTDLFLCFTLDFDLFFSGLCVTMSVDKYNTTKGVIIRTMVKDSRCLFAYVDALTPVLQIFQ
jgi:hypothetical protein